MFERRLLGFEDSFPTLARSELIAKGSTPGLVTYLCMPLCALDLKWIFGGRSAVVRDAETDRDSNLLCAQAFFAVMCGNKIEPSIAGLSMKGLLTRSIIGMMRKGMVTLSMIPEELRTEKINLLVIASRHGRDVIEHTLHDQQAEAGVLGGG